LTIASQLAFLYETARDPGRASDYFLLAAQNAQRIFANQEAIALARRGVALLGKIPETPERTRKELNLQVTLAFSLMCTLGYAAPETGANMGRACELCQASHDDASLCLILWGLWAYYLCKGDMKSARNTAEHVLNISRTLNDPVLFVGSHCALAMSLLHQGELIAARPQFEEVARLHDVAKHSRYVQLYRFDPGVHSAAQMIRLLWLLGFPDRARRKAEETLALARELSSPLSLAFIQLFAVQLYQHLRQPEKVREDGEVCITLCEEQAIQLERAWAECWYGWAIAELGETDNGISRIRSALDTQLSIGAQVARSYCLAILANALWHAGRTEEGLQAVKDGLAVSKRNGEPFYDAELWRLKGELLKMQGKTGEAEASFQKAIEIARQQSAKSLELRACTSLACLWQKQGKRTEAGQVLSEIYAWFTEGFDTADLKQAASLLGELS
jgi:adenylate cyclase